MTSAMGALRLDVLFENACSDDTDATVRGLQAAFPRRIS